MKKNVAIAMVAAGLVVSSKFAFADTYEDSRGLTWNYSYNSVLGGAVVNSARGCFWLPSMEYPITDPIGEVQIPPQFPNNNPYVLHYNIPTVKIGRGAFSGCDRLTEVVVPSSMVVIGDSAFLNCTNLRSVASTYNAHGVVLHDGVTDIGSYAFSGCSRLESVIIPDSVINIGDGAFKYCDGLLDVTIGNGVTNIHGDVFAGCSGLTSLTIPQGVCSAKLSDTFPSAYQSITNIVISDSVTSIGKSAFYGCAKLVNMTIPNGVTSMGDQAFQSCADLKSVKIPDGVTSIGYGTFQNCRKLASVSLPCNLKSIGDSAFYGCSELASLAIPNSVTNIGARAFFGTPFYNNQPDGLVVFGKIAYKVKGSSPDDLVVPEGIESIGNAAFADCSTLATITFPDTVTSIGDAAFSGCDNLMSITFKGDAPIIGQGCFSSVNSSCVVYVEENSTGWNVAIPGVWNGIRIEFVPAMCTVAFDATGGLIGGSSSMKSVAFGAEIGALPVPTRYGYVFSGWWTSPNGGTQISVRTMVQGDITYYAQWERLPAPTWIIEDGMLTGVADWNGCTTAAIPDGVTSIGDSAFYKCSSLVEVIIPDSVKSIGDYAFRQCSHLTNVEIGSGVTNIGACAFNYCTQLTCIEIPYGVISIGQSAFLGCSSLSSVIMRDGVISIGQSAFSGTPYLNNQPDGLVVLGSVAYTVKGTCPAAVTIPDGVKSITANAFYGCSGLMRVTIPNSVTIIGDSAFCGCSGLTCAEIPDSVINIGVEAFYGCSGLASANDFVIVKNVLYEYTGNATHVTIPDGVIRIGNRAFYNCRELTSVTISDGVTDIGDGAFEFCRGLTNLTFLGSLINIGGYAFASCDGLTSVRMPDSIESIGDSAFSYCSALTSMVIPDSVTSIGTCAFESCSSLTNIEIGCQVMSIGGGAFMGCSKLKSFIVNGGNASYKSGIWMLLTKDGKTLVACVNGAATIPDSVCNIGPYAFSCCNGLTNLMIPGTVTNIAHHAFDSCSALTSVTIPNNVISVGNYAFSYCSGINSLTIEDGVTSIGYGAFYGCNRLKKVSIPNSATSIEPYAFSHCGALTSVTIPSSMTSIGDYAFESCNALTAVYITDLSAWCSITFGASYANPLCYAHNLYLNGALVTNLAIPSGVTSISDRAFYGCSGLKTVSVPDSVVGIGSLAFNGCNGLTAVYISDLRSWCATEFNGSGANPLCYAHKLYLNGDLVTDLGIPDGVTSIGDYAFYGCSGLTSVAMPDSVTTMGRDAFYGCSGLKSITISQCVCSRMLSEVFSSAYQTITNVVISDSVTSIDDYAFYGCSGLASITIPGSVTNIGNSSFLSCRGLVRVVIPDSVTSIGHDAFEYCMSLTNVVFVGDAPKVDTSTFASVCSACTAIVRPSSIGWDVAIPGVWRGIKIAYSKAVVFDANGGELPLNSRYLPEGSMIGMLPIPTRIGYTFAGWFTVPSGGAQISAETIVLADEIYYAHWVMDNYTVTFDANGGSGDTTMILNYGASLGVLPIPTHGDCYFDGWFTEACGGSSISSATTILGDVTYYAHWSDAIPPLSDGATVEMVAEALSGSADERLIERVGTVGAYQSYRQWIVQNSLAHKDVRASRNSWLAYAIDSPMLIGKSPVANEDLSIVSFAPSGNIDGTFKLVFGIDDTEIGDGATPERIAEAFGIEGATELSTSAFSSDRVSVAFERSADGKANAMITPIGNPQTFFMRVKIN